MCALLMTGNFLLLMLASSISFSSVNANPPVSTKKGLTFVKAEHQVPFGVDKIACRDWSILNGPNCDAYAGDTLCSELRPVLCAKTDGSPRPPYLITGGSGAMSVEFYNGWALGHITTTVPVKGSQFVNRAAVDAFCAQSFGAGWRVATFHDGKAIPGMNGTLYAGDQWTQNFGSASDGGWAFYSYGDVRTDTRFWIHIRDQPSTCWTQ